MDAAQNLIRRGWHQFMSDGLFRNSAFLMASSVLTSMSGFIFWLLAARFFTASEVGVTSALVSATLLIASFSLLGINAVFIRYLANHPDRNTFVWRGIIASVAAALVIAMLYVTFISRGSTNLSLVFSSSGFMAVFFIAACMNAFNMVSDSIFIALQAAKYVFLENVFLSISRIVAPLFVQDMDARALFIANMVGVLAATIITIAILVVRYRFALSKKVFTRTNPERTRFALSNYVMSIFVSGPALIYPTIIIMQAGAATAGYYYLAGMVANVIAIIPLAISQSLFAEISRDITTLDTALKRSVKLLAILLIPTVALSCLIIPVLFTVFYGSEYAAVTPLLRLLIVATLCIAINQVIIVVGRALGYMKELVSISMASMVLAIALVYWWSAISITAIGYAWLVANICSSLCYVALIKKYSLQPRKAYA